MIVLRIVAAAILGFILVMTLPHKPAPEPHQYVAAWLMFFGCFMALGAKS